MNIWGLIGQSYVLPLQRFGDMWRVFWPAAVIWAATLFVSEYVFALTNSDAAFIWLLLAVFSVWIYQTFVMASGLIRWHRHLIYDEAPKPSRLWLFAAEWRFWWRWFWLGIVAIVIGMLFVAAIAMLSAIFFIAVGGNPFEFSEPESPVEIWLILTGIFVTGMAICGWLFPRTFLSLAAIAVREGDSYRRIAKQQVSRADCFLLGFATLVTTAPLTIVVFFPIIFQEPAKTDGSYEITFLYVVITVVANVISFIAVIVFATMLSLFYRSRISAAPQAASAP